MVNVRCPMTAIYYVVCNSYCLLFPKESKFGESMSSYKTRTCDEHSSGEKYLSHSSERKGLVSSAYPPGKYCTQH
jgi:hypothetical protein